MLEIKLQECAMYRLTFFLCNCTYKIFVQAPMKHTHMQNSALNAESELHDWNHLYTSQNIPVTM